MIQRQSVPAPFSFRMIREFLVSDEELFGEMKPIGNREFYTILAMVIGAVLLLAVTIGPLAIV